MKFPEIVESICYKSCMHYITADLFNNQIVTYLCFNSVHSVQNNRDAKFPDLILINTNFKSGGVQVPWGHE